MKDEVREEKQRLCQTSFAPMADPKCEQAHRDRIKQIDREMQQERLLEMQRRKEEIR